MQDLYRQFAAYNRWANERLYAVAATLAEADYLADRGAFFGSVNNTLNHLLIADRIWLHRMTGEGPAAGPLNQVLFTSVVELTAARAAEDARLIAFVDGLDEARLNALVVYHNASGKRDERPLWQVLSHIFNHQTHHRAQAQTLLHQFGKDVPELDLIFFLRATTA